MPTPASEYWNPKNETLPREDLERLKLASWATAMENLRAEWQVGGPSAVARAEKFAHIYVDRRAAMVFDCVMSRQRRYKVVETHVERFQRTENAASLAILANLGPGGGPAEHRYPFTRGEAATIRTVAAGLVRYGEERGLDEEAAVTRWATESGPYEREPHLDPYVGSTKGIGPALFSYLRMRCGADGIKVDLRVRAVMGSLLFPLGDGSDLSLLCVCGAAATELGVTRLQLDQLLWWLQEEEGSTTRT